MPRAFVALGSNFGDRLGFVSRAWQLIELRLGRIRRTSRLYDTAPALVTDQPRFLNAVVALDLPPHVKPLEALIELKGIERDLGRRDRGRYGPREIDLDLLFVDNVVVSCRGGPLDLDLPHPRVVERDFVLRPLADVARPLADAPSLVRAALDAGTKMRLKADDSLVKVWAGLPVGSMTHVMAILNATPDSFSDGGRLATAEAARAHARQCLSDGAAIVDVGGESTRPGALVPTVAEELDRVVPAIEAIAADSDVLISVDTRRAAVAEGMLPLLAGRTGASCVLMHMRGTPATMGSVVDYGGDVVSGVAAELTARLEGAVAAGIAPWRIALDPGIGFAKDAGQNVDLLRGLELLADGMDQALLVGPSRKRFLGDLVGEPDAARRDAATAGACCASVPHADILRVHNVRLVKQALTVADAVLRRRRWEASD